MSLWTWIKTNKLAVFLILVVCFLLFKEFQPQSYRTSYEGDTLSEEIAPPSMAPAPMMARKVESVGGSGQRWVIQESQISLLVKEVKAVGEQIIAHAKSLGGYMVQASYTKPEEKPFATVIVRVPTLQFEEALKFFKSLGLKVISENLMGTDVTDQYVDIEGRLATLRKTKTKLEQILTQSGRVRDIVDAQIELTNIEQQIDSLIGQKKAIEEGAKLTKITVYLSTDELALPYTPDETFRPAVTFKLAVRSLLSAFRSISEGLIWLGVYAAFWVPALVGFLIYRRWRKTK